MWPPESGEELALGAGDEELDGFGDALCFGDADGDVEDLGLVDELGNG